MVTMEDSKRTIETVIDCVGNTVIHADEFFARPTSEIWNYRIKCRKSIQKNLEPVFICEVCLQKVQISGGGNKNKKIPHFSHFKDSLDCPIKTNTNLPKAYILASKFLGQKEGWLHIETKNLLATFLAYNVKVKDIQIEKVLRDKENPYQWRKPDVSASYGNVDVVFEVQLSTTFLDVILEREEYYKNAKTFILWIFREFEQEDDKQRFTQKDIFYSNNRNAFVLDKQAIEKSQAERKFYLTCHYQDPIINNDEIIFVWKEKLVELEDLTFDKEKSKVYFIDVDELESNKYTELSNQIQSKSSILLLDIDDEESYDIEKHNLFEATQTSAYQAFKDKNIEFYTLLDDNTKNTRFLKVLRGNYLFASALYGAIKSFFLKENQLTIDDKKFLSLAYQKEMQLTNKPKNEQSIIYLLSQVVFHAKLNNPTYSKNLYDRNIIDLLFTILSFKEKQIFSYNYNWIQVFNHWFNDKSSTHYRFAHVVGMAIEVYYKGGIDGFINNHDNNKRTISKKFSNFIENDKSTQCYFYNDLLNTIFPELAL